MSDFSHSSSVKATRKRHTCEQCNKSIEIGSPAKYFAGKYEGDIYSMYAHIECNAAANAFATLNDLWFEDYPWFQHMDDSEFEHHAWLLAEHPIVAERLGIHRVKKSPDLTAPTPPGQS